MCLQGTQKELKYLCYKELSQEGCTRAGLPEAPKGFFRYSDAHQIVRHPGRSNRSPLTNWEARRPDIAPDPGPNP